MPETSVVMKLVDEYSAKAKSIASANRGLSKELEELITRAQQQDARLSALNKQHAELSRSLRDAGAELKAARRQFDSTGSAVDSAALDAAHQKYDRPNSDLRLLSRSAKEAEKDLHDTAEQMRRLVTPSGAAAAAELLLRCLAALHPLPTDISVEIVHKEGGKANDYRDIFCVIHTCQHP